MLRIFSSGNATPFKQECLDSVKRQICGVPFVHTYIEDSIVRRGSLYHFWDFLATCDPSDIVACLDGDDALQGTSALETVARLYQDKNIWLTYGSFVVVYGTREWPDTQCNLPLGQDATRATAKCPSHLRTFRAGLAQRLRKEDLQRPDGRWFNLPCRDYALMMPLMEMAGPRHRQFVAKVLVRYRWDGAEMRTASEIKQMENKREKAMIRAMRPYAALKSLDGSL